MTIKSIFSIFISFFLSCAFSTIKAQTDVRPYKEWEATQFVAVSGHQPEDYVLTDNNWEIMYNLRTPHTQRELLDMGIKCSDRVDGSASN